MNVAGRGGEGGGGRDHVKSRNPRCLYTGQNYTMLMIQLKTENFWQTDNLYNMKVDET